MSFCNITFTSYNTILWVFLLNYNNKYISIQIIISWKDKYLFIFRAIVYILFSLKICEW